MIPKLLTSKDIKEIHSYMDSNYKPSNDPSITYLDHLILAWFESNGVDQVEHYEAEINPDGEISLYYKLKN